MTEYEVIWDGRHDGVNRDLLCVPQTEIRNMAFVEPQKTKYQPWGDLEERIEMRARLLSLLAERPTWRVAALKMELGANGRFIYGMLQTLHRHQLIRTVCHGTVALRRASEALQR